MWESKLWHRWTCPQNRNRFTDSHIHRLWLSRAESGEGRIGSLGFNRCKLLYIGWINNKVLLYNPGKYIQYPMVNFNGKDWIHTHTHTHTHTYIDLEKTEYTHTHTHTYIYIDFPGGSNGKESACSTGDAALIPESGRSPGEENGYRF